VAQSPPNIGTTTPSVPRSPFTIECMDVTFTLTVHVRACNECKLADQASVRDYLETNWTRMGGVGETDLRVYCDHEAMAYVNELSQSYRSDHPHKEEA
jgi:hypothetical protein